MKNTILFGFTVILVLFSLESSAQFFVGGKVSINMSSISHQPKIQEFDVEGGFIPKMGLDLGGVMTYRFNPYFSMQTEFDYSRKGFKSNLVNYKINLDSIADGTWNYTYDYIEIPLMFKVGLGSKGFNPYFEFGAYYGYMVYASRSVDAYVNNNRYIKDKQKGFDGFSANESLSRNEYGFKVGIGGTVDISKGMLIINIRYSQGMTDIAKIPNYNNKVVNRVFQLGIGYLIEVRSSNTNKIYYY